MGLTLTIIATVLSACGSGDSPVDTPPPGNEAPPQTGTGLEFPNEPEGFVLRSQDLLDDGTPSWNILNRAGTGSVVENPNAPIAPPYAFRATYPAGMPGGHEASLLFTGSAGGTTSSFYLSHTFRLSANWDQGTTSLGDGTFGVKHVIPFVIPDGGTDPLFFGWTGWGKDSEHGWITRFRIDGWAPGTSRRDVPHIDAAAIEAARFSLNEWVRLEVLVEFNDGGDNTGRIRMWTNGTLTHDSDGEHFPTSELSEVQIAGTFGGGIGNVPHEQWYEVDHIRVSAPPN